jgi:hypothetical protein
MTDAQHPTVPQTIVDSTAMASNFGYWLEKALTVPVYVRRYGRIIAVLTACTLEPVEAEAHEQQVRV